LDAKTLLDTPAEQLLEIKAETLAYTLGYLHSEALFDTLAHTLTEVEFEKPAATPLAMSRPSNWSTNLVPR